MSNRNNLNIRLNYHGGGRQLDRMNMDKLKSLKKAYLYSYQAATAILSDGREFRCLINPNKLNLDSDNKILSIPFKDICLNAADLNMDDPINQTDEGDWENMENLIATLVYSAEDIWEDMVSGDDINLLPDPIPDINPGEEVVIGIQEGDVICWKENGSHWIVYLRRLEETAYFRAEMRRCRYKLTLGNGSKYWAYVRGPVEQNITWTQANGNYFNKLNNSIVIYITKNEETLKYFHRFKKIVVENNPWEVQVVDSISTPGILEISLKETFSNSIENNIEKVIHDLNTDQNSQEENIITPYILGFEKVYPYEVKKFTIKNYPNIKSNINWEIQSLTRKNSVEIEILNEENINLHILSGKSGSFDLICKDGNEIIASKKIIIGSL